MIGVFSWMFWLAVYLMLAGQLGLSELLTGGILAGLALLWSIVIRRTGGRPFKFSMSHVSPWLRAIGGLFPATARTAATLLRVAAMGGSPGRSVETAFVQGIHDAPEARARRASAILAASLAPDSFVVRSDDARQRALFHGITGTAPGPDACWLV